MHSRNVPALRLEGFDGEWAIEAIGEFARLLPHNSLSRDQLTNLDTGVSNVHYGDILVKLTAITSPDELPCVKDAGQFLKQIGHLLADGDVVFADAAEDLAVGKCTEVRGVGGKQVVAGLHTIPIRPLRSFGEAFLGYAFNADSFHNRLIPRVQGTKVSSISARVLLETELAIPPTLEEQQAIGAIFTNLDAAINQHTKKHQALQQAKTALMQRMFPQEGQTVPELRLDGFDGEWAIEAIGEFARLLPHNSLSRDQLTNLDTGVSNVHYGDILVKLTAITSPDELPCVKDAGQFLKQIGHLLADGDVVFADAAEDLAVGKCTEVRGVGGKQVVAGLHTIPIRPLRSFGEAFLGYAFNADSFHNRLIPRVQGTKVSSISARVLLETELAIPPTLEEQQAIGAVFTRLDTLITTEAKYIESLKQTKTALLQRMFI